MKPASPRAAIAIRTDARGRQLPPWEQPETRAAMGYSAAARAAVKMRARMGYSPADLAAAAKITGTPDPRRVVRGRAYDPASRRWYKDGYAPWQLTGDILATCGACGRYTLVIRADGYANCAACHGQGKRFVP